MATVIKLVNELIGKEDINWGDASTTFSRETYTGGNVSLHYIDDTVIPATALGGYVDDHLHVQNTDTGTTSTTFTINSGGYSPILSSTGLTADRTFTFPNTSNQALVGATDLAGTTSGVGASTVGIYDAGAYYTGTEVESALAEIGADITTLTSTVHNSGMKNGFRIGYSAANAITISGGIWAHNGTSNQHLYTASQITFTLGPSGSNAASVATAISTLSYIYIDDSAVVSSGSRLLTAAEFVNNTTAPTWSESKIGWYNGNDRCIGAVYGTGTNTISQFDIFDGAYYRYRTSITQVANTAAGLTATGANFSSYVPAFSNRVRIGLLTGTSQATYYLDSYSSSTPEVQCVTGQVTVDMPLDSSRIGYWWANSTAGTTIYVRGYYTDRL